jgi:hypothetical protein
MKLSSAMLHSAGLVQHYAELTKRFRAMRHSAGPHSAGPRLDCPVVNTVLDLNPI